MDKLIYMVLHQTVVLFVFDFIGVGYVFTFSETRFIYVFLEMKDVSLTSANVCYTAAWNVISLFSYFKI